MSTKEHHMAIYILNTSSDTSRLAALRVSHQSIRGRTWYRPTPDGAIARSVRGEVTHVEAEGIIVMTELTELTEAECAAAMPHEHCTADKPHPSCQAIPHVHPALACMLPEAYPVSIRFDAPCGDGVVPFLGDNLIVSIRRAEGELEHQYAVTLPERSYNHAQVASD